MVTAVIGIKGNTGNITDELSLICEHDDENNWHEYIDETAQTKDDSIVATYRNTKFNVVLTIRKITNIESMLSDNQDSNASMEYTYEYKIVGIDNKTIRIECLNEKDNEGNGDNEDTYCTQDIDINKIKENIYGMVRYQHTLLNIELEQQLFRANKYNLIITFIERG